MKKLHLFLLLCLALLLAACDNGGGSGQNATASATARSANSFGSAASHIHSLVVLPDTNHTLFMATHYGIFRSQDHGAAWQETAGGPGQLMQDVMTYYLSYNLTDPQRLYVLTVIRTAQSLSSELGFYTSSDVARPGICRSPSPASPLASSTSRRRAPRFPLTTRLACCPFPTSPATCWFTETTGSPALER